MSKEKKQRLKGSQKDYREAKKLKKIFSLFFSFHSIKLEQKTIHFEENSIIKITLYKNKKAFNIKEVEIKRIASSDKKWLSKDSFKYFIRYRHKGNAFPSPLCIKLSQMNVYTKYFDKNNKYMNCLVKDEKTLKKN